MERDQPFSMAAAAYQSRASGSSSFCMRAIWWYQGNCASGACTIALSAQVSAKALMYLRFRGENPFACGNWVRRSAESRSMTRAPSLPVVADRGCSDQSPNRSTRDPDLPRRWLGTGQQLPARQLTPRGLGTTMAWSIASRCWGTMRRSSDSLLHLSVHSWIS